MQIIGKLKTVTSLEAKGNGVSIGFECLDRDLFKPEKCYDLLGQTGCKFARVQTGWSKCEKQKGVYDFSWLDDVVDNLLARGIRPFFNVGYGNPIYMECSNPTGVGCVPTLAGEAAADAWRAFIRALAKHFVKRVTHYEIWNEPNIPNFWYPGQSDPAEYAELVRLTGGVIRSVNPEARIGANVSYMYRLDFVKGILENLRPGDIHFFSYHAYGVTDDFHLSFDVHYKHWQRLLDRYGFTDVELWQTEAGFPTWAPEGYHMVTPGIEDERPQAVFMLRRYFADFFHGAKVASFFQMADMWEKPYQTAASTLKKPGGHGILNGLVYTPKLSYTAFSHLAALFDGDIAPSDVYVFGDMKKYAGWRHYSDPFEECAIQLMSFVRNGYPFYAYYLPSPITEQRVFNRCFRLCVEDAPKEPILIDPLTGEIYAIDTANEVNGYTEYRLLPMKDYPMVVTDRKAVAITE